MGIRLWRVDRFPRSLVFNVVHGFNGYAMNRGNLAVGFGCHINRMSLLLFELGIRRFLAMQRTANVATFRGHIAHVLGMSPDKQMLRIHAKTIVAAMQYAQLWINRTIKRDPQNTMRSKRIGQGTANQSISMTIPCALPLKAFAIAASPRPDSYVYRTGLSHV